jgi:hypothetical protein
MINDSLTSARYTFFWHTHDNITIQHMMFGNKATARLLYE